MASSFQAVEESRRALLGRHGYALVGAIATETVFFYPIDTMKTLLQVSANAGKSMGISAIVDGVRETSGLTGEVQERRAPFQSKLKKIDPRSALRASAHWKSIGKSLFLLPAQSPNLIPALKEYPWLATGSGQPPLVKDGGGLRGAVQLEGWKRLWSRLRPGLFRDAIYGGCFFSSWQYLDDVVAEWKAYRMDPPPSSWEEVGPSSPLLLSTTAGIAASFAATASHSFDTARTRAQATVVPKYLAMERTLLRWKLPGSWFKYIVGFSPLDRRFLRRALGVRALLQGLGTFALVLTYNTSLQTALAQKKLATKTKSTIDPKYF